MITQLIAIGTSAGGVDAIARILRALPPGFETPIAIVQHLPSNSNADVRLIFGRHTTNQVFGIEDKMPIEKGGIYFAPPNYHVLIEKSFSFALSQDEPVHYSRPSIDVFLQSAARAYGPTLTGVVLTGANEDGAAGMACVQELGGMTLVQDPNDAEISFMPSEVIRRIRPDHIFTLSALSQFLIELGASSSRGKK